MTMYLNAIFNRFYVLECSKYVLECREYVLECSQHILKQSKCTVIITCYLFHQKGVDLCRSLKIYVEESGLSLRSGRPSENRIPHKIISFSSCFYITVATSHEMQEKVLSFLLNILSLREVIWTI